MEKKTYDVKEAFAFQGTTRNVGETIELTAEEAKVLGQKVSIAKEEEDEDAGA